MESPNLQGTKTTSRATFALSLIASGGKGSVPLYESPTDPQRLQIWFIGDTGRNASA